MTGSGSMAAGAAEAPLLAAALSAAPLELPTVHDLQSCKPRSSAMQILSVHGS